MFEQLRADWDLKSADLFLLEEACRVADRLEELNSIIAGKGVLELMQFRRMDQHGTGSEDESVVIQVKFDNVLSEARQQANTLRMMLGQLKPAATDAAPSEDSGKPGGLSIDDLAARRRSRASGDSASTS